MKQSNNPMTSLKDLETYYLTKVSNDDSSMQMKIFIVMLIHMLIEMEERIGHLEYSVRTDSKVRRME